MNQKICLQNNLLLQNDGQLNSFQILSTLLIFRDEDKITKYLEISEV